jgi:uncharacterized protein (TIGR03083 family)
LPSISPEQAIGTLEDGQRQLDALVARLSEEQLSASSTIGGGDWSTKDLLSHVARWNEIALEALAAWRDGKRPWIEDVWGNGVDRLNAENFEVSRDLSPDQARDRLRQSHDSLVDAIRSMDNHEWHAEAPYPAERRTWLGMMLGSVTGAPRRPFGHAFAHIPDLDSYVAAISRSGRA